MYVFKCLIQRVCALHRNLTKVVAAGFNETLNVPKEIICEGKLNK